MRVCSRVTYCKKAVAQLLDLILVSLTQSLCLPPDSYSASLYLFPGVLILFLHPAICDNKLCAFKMVCGATYLSRPWVLASAVSTHRDHAAVVRQRSSAMPPKQLQAARQSAEHPGCYRSPLRKAVRLCGAFQRHSRSDRAAAAAPHTAMPSTSRSYMRFVSLPKSRHRTYQASQRRWNRSLHTMAQKTKRPSSLPLCTGCSETPALLNLPIDGFQAMHSC